VVESTIDTAALGLVGCAGEIALNRPSGVIHSTRGTAERSVLGWPKLGDDTEPVPTRTSDKAVIATRKFEKQEQFMQVFAKLRLGQRSRRDPVAPIVARLISGAGKINLW
jgi:hypothetical protein